MNPLRKLSSSKTHAVLYSLLIAGCLGLTGIIGESYFLIKELRDRNSSYRGEIRTLRDRNLELRVEKYGVIAVLEEDVANFDFQQEFFLFLKNTAFSGPEPIQFSYNSQVESELVIKNHNGKSVYRIGLQPHLVHPTYDFENGGIQTDSWFEVDPSSFSEGYYTAYLAAKDPRLLRALVAPRFARTFLYSPPERQCSIAVIAADNTWLAYSSKFNHYTYPDLKKTREVPHYYNNIVGRHDVGKIQTELKLLQFLDQHDYNYCLYSQREYDLKGLRNAEKLIMISGHNEYWGQQGVDRLTEHIQQNGSVIVASGNTMYRKIEYIPQGIAVMKSNYDTHMGDPSISIDLLGITFKGGTMQNDQVPKRKNSAPFRIIEDGHWVFADVNKDTFASQSSISLFEGGGCAYEADKLANDQFSLLAQGMTLGGEENRCDMVIREFDTGNFVLNFSSVGINASLMVDRETDLIYLNAIERALAN